MSTINITRISLVNTGMKIPMKERNGNIGRWFEQYLIKNGLPINTQAGPDLPTNLEVKTRKIEGKSAVNVGSMLCDDIIDTPWGLSNVRNKSQRWFYIEYSDDDSVVLDAYTMDLRDLNIQLQLQVEYEWAQQNFKRLVSAENSDYDPLTMFEFDGQDGREDFKKKKTKKYYRRDPDDRYAFFEKSKYHNDKDKQWKFRIPSHTLDSWKAFHRDDTTFSLMFEQLDTASRDAIIALV
jgi:hypothetical protein